MKFCIGFIFFIFSIGASACPHLEGTYLADGYTYEVKRYSNEKGQIFFEMFGNVYTPKTTHSLSHDITGKPIHYSYSHVSCDEKIEDSETIETLRVEVIWGDVINGKEIYRSSYVDNFFVRKDGALIVEHISNDGEASRRVYLRAH